MLTKEEVSALLATMPNRSASVCRWFTEPPEIQEQYLKLADIKYQNFDWVGEPAGESIWPRKGEDNLGRKLNEAVIPPAVQLGFAMLISEQMKSDFLESEPQRPIKRIKEGVGPLVTETEFFHDESAMTQDYLKVLEVVRPYIRNRSLTANTRGNYTNGLFGSKSVAVKRY